MGGVERGRPNFFPHISSSKVMVRLHTENQLLTWPGSATKVWVGGWWCLTGNLLIALAIA